MKNLTRILVVLIIWILGLWIANASFKVCFKIDDVSLVCENNEEKLKIKKYIEDSINYDKSSKSTKVWIEEKEQELLNTNLNADEREEIEENLKYYKKQFIKQKKELLERYIWDREYESFWSNSDDRMKEYDKMQKIRIKYRNKFWKKISNILKKFDNKKLKKIYNIIDIKKQKIVLNTRLSRSKKNKTFALYQFIIYEIEDKLVKNEESNFLKWLSEED